MMTHTRMSRPAQTAPQPPEPPALEFAPLARWAGANTGRREVPRKVHRQPRRLPPAARQT